MNHVHIHETRYVLPCDHKKHSAITEQVRFFGRHPKTRAIHFCVRHRVWRSCSCVKLYCVSARIRLGVVPTYYPVNSWPSRSSSCEESLFPCLHTHIVERFKLPPHNWWWKTILEILQDFSISETHQFRHRYAILCTVQNFEKKLAENLVRDPPTNADSFLKPAFIPHFWWLKVTVSL